MSDFDIFEGMTSISAVIKSIQNGSSDRRIIKILYNEDRLSKKFRELQFLKHTAVSLGFEIFPVAADEIDNLTAGTTHGGIIAICTKRTFPNLNVKKLTNSGFYALIEGIEDPYNFGYSVRSLYASGVDGIILPPRNWMELSGIVARSSAGTSELANIYVSDPTEAVTNLKNIGFEIICAEIRDSVSLYEHKFSDSVLLVVGGEKRGISRKILDLADTNVRIEYGREFMGSLPSASAISVISFEILRQKHNKR
ncbi:MAG: RNA methyltransferase [Ruminococcaceae bacterium]|nr:RNA methyltransferase [Oscillospiraceae bacterium]